ncbi:hypothetical protein AUEXF2481DRAFT_34431 [Aureobasidium subglaciale EXF-2481]|uniref:Uncharacterized protein n=1 Tax=Aureobasidium subglaciale (strain EXF-2481) TaxID=1043005 RepID=A0A074YR48_AURSE|nr:uncharacterized protein AUEXF2481DRAFT_34431 [Aureobasidium subglaciale EXF-2481]KAI5212203.1 hypothetical protein E4T38_00746 [Aureobasidium subglaciale]KAI5231195.1 hypothetical protein E4T40_00747 [Aureobasidium subglaciale]KAI5234165.1 hypothetical protein E4T41_00745 [Aureobasidium subglaciale]KAI5267639.1 hypothetical protein E4T46_00745 [Aureobasidium subglaciale]KER00229.1 hypothetical protein AUEXF2481DRAFT_34431 [Aureobasidium subglaciale EXF-2481]
MNATAPLTPGPGFGQSSTSAQVTCGLAPNSITPQSLTSPTMDRAASMTPSSASTPIPEPVVLSERHIQQAQPDELRTIISSLVPLLQEARTDAAHYKLQYHMLSIESTEAMERIQVEMDMAERETELLNTNEPIEPRTTHARQEADPSIRHVHVDVWNLMAQEKESLRSQNAQLEQLVSQHKRMVIQQESEIATLNDRISLYRERLRENRSHLNRYRLAAGFLDSPHKSQSTQSTPWAGRERDQPPFAALLHASDLISARNSTSPRTPRRRRAASITPMPYETPQTLQSARHTQIPQTAPSLRGPQFQPSTPQPHASARHHTTMLEHVLIADESEGEIDVFGGNLGRTPAMPQTPTRVRRTSPGKTPSNVPRQISSNLNEKASIQRENPH